MPVWSLSDTARIIIKFLFLAAFLLFLKNILFSIYGFFNDIYLNICSSITDFFSTSVPDLLGGMLHALGLDVFINSVFAILFSAGAFWLVALASIFVYKLSLKSYDSIFKALT